MLFKFTKSTWNGSSVVEDALDYHSRSVAGSISSFSDLSFLAEVPAPFHHFVGGALTLLHSERPKLFGVFAVLSAVGINPCSFAH